MANAGNDDDALASEGGSRAIPVALPPRRRWGEAELAHLRPMTEQSSLFYWKGAQTTKLVEKFQTLYPLKYCMPCSSGSAALHIAVAALKLEPGSEVIVPAITDMGSVIGVLYQQLVPVFADIDGGTYNLDPADVRRRITSKTRAIMAVHLMGNPCDMAELMAIAREFDLRMIEDCAQAWGAKWQGETVGLQGDLSCYSFNEFKHLSCGDGGIVGTNYAKWGEGLSKWGDKHYDRVRGGRDPETLSPNYRITEPQSAVAVGQLERHDEIIVRRRVLGARLTELLDPLPGVQMQLVREGNESSFWFSIVRFDPTRFSVDRDTIAAALIAEGVAGEKGYLPMPVYAYRAFQNHNFFAGRWPLREAGLTSMDYREVKCPQAEAMLADCITLQLNESMPDAYIEGVARAIGKVVRRWGR